MLCFVDYTCIYVYNENLERKGGKGEGEGGARPQKSKTPQTSSPEKEGKTSGNPGPGCIHTYGGGEGREDFTYLACLLLRLSKVR